MSHCFLSILVPVYNAEAYLPQTLDSLLNQDRQDYEILCVNDGSTDGTARVLEDYSRRFPRLKVIHQKNAGVAAARNAGLNQATGDYIWFVDADDLIAPNCLGKLWELTRQSCDRLSFGGYTFCGCLSQQEQADHKAGTLPCNVPWQDSVVWRNLLRRGFLEENDLTFRYPELTHGEDGLFMYEVSRLSPETRTIPDILYFYRVHPDSAETGVSLPSRRKRLRSHLRVTEILSDHYRRDGGENAANRLMSFLWLTLYEIADMPGADAREALGKLQSRSLYPGQIPKDCTVRKTYLADDTSPIGKVLEFFCAHLHRPWGYFVIRKLHQVKHIIRRRK